MRDRGGSAGELVPLADRVQCMQLFRLAAALVVTLFGLLAPSTLAPAGTKDLVVGTGVFLFTSLLGEWAWRMARDGKMHLFGVGLMIDGVYLGWATYITGGIVSPLRYLILLHLIAVTLLASHRTGLKLALWHSLLLFVVFYAQESNDLRPFGRAVETLPGSNFQQLLGFIIVILLVAVLTGTLSAVNERELRRRRFDLEALAKMAVALEGSGDPVAVAGVLLDSVVDTFGVTRAAVLGGPGHDMSLISSRGTGRATTDPHPGSDSVMTRAADERETQLVSELDADEDSWLVALFPKARNVVVVPLTAEGRAVGMLIMEHSLRSGSRIERRVVSTLERFAFQAALAMRNAWLVEQLQQVAATDGLTGIANRRAFDTILEREVVRAARNGTPVTLVMLDIDHFKNLNDTHGHQQGDDVLRRVAAAIAEQCRDYDTAARYGGEEFAVILPSCTAAEAFAAGERLRRAILDADAPVVVTASGGVATFPGNATNAASLVLAADEALYESKRAGRNRITISAREAGPCDPSVDLTTSALGERTGSL